MLQTLRRDRQRVQIPNAWRPRPHQLALWTYLENGGRRAVAVWHRRAGKDSLALNWTSVAAHQRVGNYWHMLPEAAQARKAIWNGIDREGRRIIDQAFPKAIRAGTVDNEMMIRFKVGSTWQVVGSDNYNSLVGANPIGVVFSEYSLAKPAAWDFIRPILRENGGWAVFIYTPRGKNHGHKLYNMARKEPGWFAELLGVHETKILTPEDIEAERREGMSDEMVEQEYYVSFEGAVEGAYYAKEMAATRKAKRICFVPYDQSVPCNTFWDLGANDTTAIWVHQYVGMQHRFLKTYEKSGEPLAHFVKWLKDQPYTYDTHYLPHDADHVRLGGGGPNQNKSIKQMLQALLPNHRFVVLPRIEDITVGIQQTRDKFAACWFDEDGCEDGLNALGQYHKEWDEKGLCWKATPRHDWSSNYADAFRQFGQGWKSRKEQTSPKVAPFKPKDPGFGF